MTNLQLGIIWPLDQREMVLRKEMAEIWNLRPQLISVIHSAHQRNRLHILTCF